VLVFLLGPLDHWWVIFSVLLFYAGKSPLTVVGLADEGGDALGGQFSEGLFEAERGIFSPVVSPLV